MPKQSESTSVEIFPVNAQFLTQPPALTEITHPNDWLVREHLDMHRHLAHRFSATTVTNAFHALVDARSIEARRREGPGYNLTTGYVYDSEAQAFPLRGIKVAERTTIGYLPFDFHKHHLATRSRSLAKFAFQAGSLQSAEDTVRTLVPGQTTQSFLLSLIDRLNQQIQLS